MQPRKELKLNLYITEIINDVEMNTVKTADTVTGEGSTEGLLREVRAKLQIGGSEGDEIIALRLIGDSASQLRAKFPDYLATVFTENNNLIYDGEKDMALVFDMPYRWNEATMDALTTAVHRFIVNKCIERWHRLVNRTDFAANYEREANEALDDVKAAINTRKKPKRGTKYDTNDDVKTWYVYKGTKGSGDESTLLHATAQPEAGS